MTPKFAEAVDPIFLNVLGLLDRIERLESPKPEDVRVRLRVLIDEAEARLGTGEEWQLAKYALVAWIDEMLIDAPWDSREWWKNNVLEQFYFNTRIRNQNYFMLAKQAAELTGRDALEVFYVCVVLGFRGLYHDPASGPALALSLELPEDLSVWAKQAALSIRLGQDRPDLSGPVREIEGAPPLRSRSGIVWPWLTSCLLVTASVIYAYYIYAR